MSQIREKIEKIVGSAPKLFVTAIDTDAGKTVVSSLLVKELQYDYWKPIQCGELDQLDSSFVKSINPQSIIHPESVLLNLPASPHLSAKKEGRTLSKSDFNLPITQKGLIIEGAGGVIVPINETGLTVFDLIQDFADGIIVVTKHYLGSLNHTLLTLDKLKQGNVPIVALVFNGDIDEESESIIQKMHPEISNWLRLPISEELDKENLKSI